MPRIVLFVLMAVLLAGVLVVAAQEDSVYTVQYGDVLDIIAASVNLSASCIAEQSGIENPNKLRPGDTLILSAACPPYDGLIPIEREPAAEASSAAAPGQGGGGTAFRQASSVGDTYYVMRGDVLDLIGARFDLSVRCLAEANNLVNPGRIYIGDEIFLDPDCPPYEGEAPVINPRSDASAQTLGRGGGGSAYTVQYGDTLDSIGAEFNLSPRCLGESNNLANPSRIFPGDQITLDPGCPPYDGLALVQQQNN
ncbi:MAG TPA: LysM domain-containing protein [Spirillospora sp.]|nr:LysM domain-containing protein [Spirillospora sp.]